MAVPNLSSLYRSPAAAQNGSRSHVSPLQGFLFPARLRKTGAPLLLRVSIRPQSINLSRALLSHAGLGFRIIDPENTHPAPASVQPIFRPGSRAEPARPVWFGCQFDPNPYTSPARSFHMRAWDFG